VKDMVEISDYLAENGWRPQQVQDFTPTPMTLATDMYYSGYHPNTGKPVHVPKDPDEKAMQRALLQPHLAEYRETAARGRKLAGAGPRPQRKRAARPAAGRVSPSDAFED
jgi:radical SAM superfamily enzyme YgiQ (UPF0313 family)